MFTLEANISDYEGKSHVLFLYLYSININVFRFQQYSEQ